MSSNKVTILVNSCDKYEDAWKPFFLMFHEQWSDCPYEFVLNTETKYYSFDKFSVRTVHPISKDSISWSRRCTEALRQIDSEYILFMLEDYFLLSTVNTEVFNRAVSILDNDISVGAIILSRTSKENTKIADYKDADFYLRRIDKNFKAWSLPILYRKDYLLNLLRDYESVWEFEAYAWYRAKRAKKILLQQNNNSPEVFEYLVKIEKGVGITQGKWLPGNKALFEAHGIYNVNFDNIGVISVEDALNNIKPKISDNSKKEKGLIEILYKCKKAPQKIMKKLKKSAFYHYIRK